MVAELPTDREMISKIELGAEVLVVAVVDRHDDVGPDAASTNKPRGQLRGCSRRTGVRPTCVNHTLLAFPPFPLQRPMAAST